MSKYFLFFTLLSIHYSNAKNNQTEKPKLVVAIVVDQMRYDFLENLSHRYSDNGFNRLVNAFFASVNLF